MVITIDGLSVNGKSTLAGMIARKLNFKNFNTGAVYRCIALQIVNNELDINNIDEVINKIGNMQVNFRGDQILLNDEDVTKKIKVEEISLLSNRWGAIPEIKAFVRIFQKSFIKSNDTVMEGRDIAARIAPDAEIKFYLYSDFETRVQRAWNKDKSIDIEEIRKNLHTIDDIDINGGNFIKPKDAIEINTTNLSIDEVYNVMMEKISKIV